MVREANTIADSGHRGVDLVNVINIVSMGIDVGVIRNRDIVTDLDTAAVVQENMTVDHNIVTEAKVVAERPLHKMPTFKVLSYPCKDVRGKHPSKPVSKDGILSKR